MSRIIRGSDVSYAYHRVLQEVINAPVVAPRGLRVRERLSVMVDISHPRFEPIRTRDNDRNLVMVDYTQREIKLYERGELDAAAWRDEASKFWWEIRNPNDTINSNYGYLTTRERDAYGYVEWVDIDMGPRGISKAIKNAGPVGSISPGITQWEWARESLKRDSDTRQAVMHFNRPRHQWFGNKDFPCTMYGIFHIRDDAMFYSVHMRSQDVVKGWPYDVLYFAWQQAQMAKELSVGVGNLCVIVDSLHMYERDLTTVSKMLHGNTTTS